MAPPDVPLPIHYYKLGDLLESVKRGQRFAAVTVADIRSGTARPLLFTKDAQASSGAKKADAAKAGALFASARTVYLASLFPYHCHLQSSVHSRIPYIALRDMQASARGALQRAPQRLPQRPSG